MSRESYSRRIYFGRNMRTMQHRRTILPGRGQVLEQETRDAMVALEAVDPLSDYLPEGLVDDRIATEILSWFVQMSDDPDRVSPAVRNEQKFYFRALFNLSIDKRTRLRFVDSLNALGVIVTFLERLPSEDSLSTLMAAVANLVYEDTSKMRFMTVGDIPVLFTNLLRWQNSGVATHTARGIFSLTTVYDFKKRFAVHEGLLSALISCLSRESNPLIMNAAGAIANIAIHPESKVPIVQLGALDPLMELGLHEEDEGVLHQVSRCLFSLAAERQNRPVMCTKGILPIIARLLNYNRHSEILTNAIGCFGNLAMSEPAASEQSIPMALRLLPMLGSSTNQTLDRQATRVLLSFATKEAARKVMGEHRNMEILVRKLDSRDHHVVRDVLGILSTILCGSMELKQGLCELGGLRKVLELFAVNSHQRDDSELLPPLVRVLFGVVGCAEAKEAVCSEKHGRMLRELCDLILQSTFSTKLTSSQTGSIVKHALGTLATIACEEKHVTTLVRYGALRCGVSALLSNTRQDVRRQAGRLLYNITRGNGVALTYMCRFGGPDGERWRLDADLKGLFRDCFAFIPSSAARIVHALSSSSSPSGGNVREGLLALQVQCLVGSDGDTTDAFTAMVPEALVRARCPNLDRIGAFKLSERSWRQLFEFLCTNSISQNGTSLDSEMSLTAEPDTKLKAVLHELGVRIGTVTLSPGAAAADAYRLPLVIGLPTDSDQPIFGLAVPPLLSFASSSTLGSTSALESTTDIADDSSVRDDCDTIGAGAAFSNEWTKCMTTKMLSARVRGHGPRLDRGQIFLRPTYDEFLADAATEPTMTPNSMSYGPLTRARRRAMASGSSSEGSSPNGSEGESGSMIYSPFVQSLIEEWAIVDGVCLEKGKRKRRFAKMNSRDMRFRVDKLLLASRSRYFRSLLQGPFAESQSVDGEERVVDFRGTPDTLVVTLRYIYCGLDMELEDALASDADLCWRTLMTAHEYGLEGLQYSCERCIVNSMNNLEEALAVVDIVQSINAPFIKLTCANLAYTNRASRLRPMASTVLDKVGMPLVLSPQPHRNPRSDSGGIESEDLDGSLDAEQQPGSAQHALGTHRKSGLTPSQASPGAGSVA